MVQKRKKKILRTSKEKLIIYSCNRLNALNVIKLWVVLPVQVKITQNIYIINVLVVKLE